MKYLFHHVTGFLIYVMKHVINKKDGIDIQYDHILYDNQHIIKFVLALTVKQ